MPAVKTTPGGDFPPSVPGTLSRIVVPATRLNGSPIAPTGDPSLRDNEADSLTASTPRDIMIAAAYRESELLFGPCHETPDKKKHGGYSLYITDEPGHFIVQGPLESRPGTRGKEQGKPTYTVRCFSLLHGEMRGGDCDEGCECKQFGICGTCKHYLAVRAQITLACAIVAVATPPDNVWYSNRRPTQPQPRAESARPLSRTYSQWRDIPPTRSEVTPSQRAADWD